MLDADVTLTALLSKGQVSKERARDVTLPASRIDGYPSRNAERMKAFHARLELAAEVGTIALEWERFYEGTQLQRVRLLDSEALAAFLGVPYLPAKVDAAFGNLDMKGIPDWLSEAMDLLKERWLAGKAGFGLTVGDAERLPFLLTAIRALDSLPPDITFDFRQFGARYLGDSKITKKIAAPLAALYRTQSALRDLDPAEVLAQLNLVPLAQPVLLRGRLQLFNGKQSVSTDVFPYIGVPTEFLHEFSIDTQPDYILTIENQSSFNEYTATVADGGIVIYTAGFPARSIQEFYRRLVEATVAPVYHWGDTDVGGFKILKHLQGVSCRNIKPHLMNTDSGAEISKQQARSLSHILPVNPLVDTLIQHLIDRGYGFIEQESVSASPVKEN